MADLTRRSDGERRRPADARGQLLLIAAFVLAALFVTLALILNAVIYTENLATRAESTTSDAIAHTQDVEQATVDLLRYVNEHATPASYSTLQDRYELGLGNFTNASARFQLTSGVVIRNTPEEEFRGTLLKQTNESRNFTNVGGANEWSPVNDSAGGAHTLRIEVRDVGTDLASSWSNAFEIEATDTAGEEWTLEVTTSDVRVTPADGSPDTCPTGSGNVWINVSRGTVDGVPCDSLDFGGGLGTIDSVEFENAHNIVGTYRLVVNKTVSNVDTGLHDFGSPPKVPFKEEALFGAVVGIDYQRTTLVYRTDLRVVPGETDG